MARRASSGINTQALLIGVLLIAAILGGGYFFLNRTPAGFDAPQLDVASAMENGKSLAGNRNQVTGILVDRRIRAVGQVVALKVEENGATRHLTILIPSGFKAGNLNLQAKYTFLVEFNTDGQAVALDVKQL